MASSQRTPKASTATTGPTLAVTPSSTAGRLFVAARTDIGRRRVLNEDAVLVLSGDEADLPETDLVFIVADGMGGMQAGDVASQEAVRVVRESLEKALAVPGADPQNALEYALRRANDVVYALAKSDFAGTQRLGKPLDSEAPTAGGGSDAGASTPAQEPGGVMGTTCVTGVVQADTLFLAHVGDSRAYLLRDSRLHRLTTDHSFVEERVRAGDLTEDEARRSRFRNMITRAVGIEAQIVPELRTEALSPGDTLLVCTDGLTTMLSDAEVESALVKASGADASGGATWIDVDSASRALIDLANRRGGGDNISVVLVHLPADRGAAGAAVPATAAPAPATNGVAAQTDGERNGSDGVAPVANGIVVDLDATGDGRSQRGRDKTAVSRSERSRPARRPASPLVRLLALIGFLALVLTGVLAASEPLRNQALDWLRGRDGRPAALTGAKPGTSRSAAATPDLSRLAYERPAPFVNRLARGDLLVYSPSGSLYFVGDASGKIVRVGRSGEILKAVATLDVAPPLALPVSPTRVFVATDVQGNVYVSYTNRRVIEKYSPKGQRLNVLKGYQRPEAVAVDEDGNLYVVDFNQVKIVRARAPRLFENTKPGKSPANTKPSATKKPARAGGATVTAQPPQPRRRDAAPLSTPRTER